MWKILSWSMLLLLHPRNHTTKLPSWKKLLYLKQPYPDNYTDKSFLSQLKRNSTVVKYSYIKLLGDFSLIVFHLSSQLIMVLTFAGIYLHKWNAFVPAMTSSALTIIAFFIQLFIGHNTKQESRPHARAKQENANVKSYGLIIFMLSILSPALKSLTRSTSSDSIWALSVILFLANTLLHDYGMNTSVASRTSSTVIEYKPVVSTNITLSHSIVLASRFNSTSQVFSFILFSIQSNILLPLFDFYIRRHNYTNFHRFVFFVNFQTVNVLIYVLLGFKILFFWWVCAFCILFLMPAYFLFIQKYKNELKGPWDPAKLMVNPE
ncbi:phosphatidylinositol N-acetylglucosaminyltransferase [Suhomyces tanzawaensis NRRL Y-17324]|uniref:Phosphatidylinositol N-acetylglucosaminyltransferase n=1 Tax=Suhomyces tanzawaensis NRRL Y-17324 TaxID=984487 RepID=A0A1E4SKH0_9ASCO|nr:phosphatidylinositol N-acetylglucosaminyltransferase [Suhomyces tanzawaensis NRRL Y-17324]ODV80001.1 phosphatidylinositol N-acetylglucosaminyltransferase [Suhomyces tanzawaensis NRRL Y-17324]